MLLELVQTLTGAWDCPIAHLAPILPEPRPLLDKGRQQCLVGGQGVGGQKPSQDMWEGGIAQGTCSIQTSLTNPKKKL